MSIRLGRGVAGAGGHELWINRAPTSENALGYLAPDSAKTVRRARLRILTYYLVVTRWPPSGRTLPNVGG